MALTKNCWSNAGKVSWRRTTYHGVPDQDHAPSNSPKNIMGEKGIKERGISEESCVKRNVPTFPGRRRDSDAVRNERHGRRLIHCRRMPGKSSPLLQNTSDFPESRHSEWCCPVRNQKSFCLIFRERRWPERLLAGRRKLSMMPQARRASAQLPPPSFFMPYASKY